MIIMKTKLTAIARLILICGIIFSANQILAADSMTNSVSETNEPSPLKIIVTPSKTRVHAGEKFKVGLEVKNVSNTNQSFKVWGCSWYENWKSSNPAIQLIPWACLANGVGTVNLAPGELFKETLNGKEAEMQVSQSVATNKISFRMCFHTGGSIHLYKPGEFVPDDVKGKSYWSDEVTININPKSVPDWIPW
jgi:hypothetical protein